SGRWLGLDSVPGSSLQIDDARTHGLAAYSARASFVGHPSPPRGGPPEEACSLPHLQKQRADQHRTRLPERHESPPPLTECHYRKNNREPSRRDRRSALGGNRQREDGISQEIERADA